MQDAAAFFLLHPPYLPSPARSCFLLLVLPSPVPSSRHTLAGLTQARAAAYGSCRQLARLPFLQSWQLSSFL